jgi:predicted ATPase
MAKLRAPDDNRAHRLNRSDTAALARATAGGNPLPASVLDQILERADGVPLFVEELTRAVLESGLSFDRERADVLKGELPRASIPATLHDSLMARLDRIGGLREIAQVAAAIGREFSSEMLQEVSGLPALKIEKNWRNFSGRNCSPVAAKCRTLPTRSGIH